MTRQRIVALLLGLLGAATIGLLTYVFPALLESRSLYAAALSKGRLGPNAQSVTAWFSAFLVNYVVFATLGVLLLFCAAAVWRGSRRVFILCTSVLGFYLAAYVLLAMFNPAYVAHASDAAQVLLISSVLALGAFVSWSRSAA